MQAFRTICCALAALALCSTARGQLPTEAVGKGVFPGLQLLPPGSVLKGISLPRYEAHRVTSLLMADELEIRTSSLIVLKKLHAFIYGENGETLEVQTDEVHGDFSLSRVTAPCKVRVVSPHFEAEGEGLVFDQDSNVGIVKGPVRTSIRTDVRKAGAPAAQQQ